MNYISVCSGIEAATVAWHSLGWKAAAYSEIEPFPSAVLAHHYPDVPNVGDMTKYKEWNIEPGSVDLLVGGTPCQSFSVAGLRKGLADPRGNLALVYCGILDHFKPRWFVWENVPGVLSSGSGRDFGSFLGAVAELGYGFAYRVLDAQYFGVAQRRRRVFVVGYLGDWRPAAKVLFERESLRGDPAPSREAGQTVAPTIAGCANGGGANGPGRDVDSVESLQPYPVANTLTARMHKGVNSTVDEGQTPVIQPISIHPHCIGRAPESGPQGKEYLMDGSAYCMDSRGQPQAVAFHPTQDPISSTDVCHSIGANQNATAAVYSFIQASDQPKSTNSVLEGMANTLTSRVGNTGFLGVPAPINQNATAAAAFSATGDDVARTITAGIGKNCGISSGARDEPIQNGIIQAMQVRRLTPVECERLQGFPDNYTAIPWRKKPTEDCPDGPRYKALGNSMAVPVMAWIGKRIQQQEG